MADISKKERDKLIKKLRQSSGIAQYALDAKMSDDQVVAASKHLEVFKLLKSANDYNRHCQAQKTKTANDKLKEFINPSKSEIFQAGKWLFNALSKNGNERKQTLLEKEIVHKTDYNDTVTGMNDTISTMIEVGDEARDEAKITIQILEKRIDTLKYQLSQIQEYIINNYGASTWKIIKDTFHIS
ncbi:hypothetical protein [Acaryochloris marina]|uniref:hypothetical protein n=1 Tax=Acaryochloris marina TaxID=155978 RepID=UPI002016FE90|nr:hypothetical protein [Acaryochloris marina]